MTPYEQFCYDLKKCNEVDLDDFISVNILNPIPKVFKGSSKNYLAFRERIAKKFNVDPNHIFLVGSSSMGFSYHKSGKLFDSDSDIDVAIVDEALFEEYSEILSTYHYDIIYHRVPQTRSQQTRYNTFLGYYAVGWLRPDKGTDIMNRHPRVNDWWEYFKSISYNRSEIGDHKVSAGIYKSKKYLLKYQRLNLINLRKSIITS